MDQATIMRAKVKALQDLRDAMRKQGYRGGSAMEFVETWVKAAEAVMPTEAEGAQLSQPGPY